MQFDAAQANLKIADFVTLLQDAVDAGASMGFLSPLPTETAVAYWQKLFDELSGGNRILLAAVEGERVVGTAQLELAVKLNAHHRAEVQKLMVHSSFQRRGIALKLLEAVDATALRAKRSLLVLDTKKGSGAEELYRKYGYIEVGSIPRFTYNSAGEFEENQIFYRLLA